MSNGSPYFQAVVQKVISSETNDARFEAFARDVLKEVEGDVEILGTSVSWDRGRDGFSVGKHSGIYVCCSLRDDVDVKVLSDLERITNTTKDIQRLYFCVSQPISEHHKDRLRGQLEIEVDHQIPVEVLGGIQIAELAVRNEILCRKYYGSEIADAVRVIENQGADGAEVGGFRLALMVAAADDTRAIREDVYRISMLEVLSDRRGRSIKVFAKDLAESLHLNRSIAVDVLNPRLQGLIEEGLVGVDGQVYSISEDGLKKVEEVRVQGVNSLFDLKAAVRKAIEEAIGSVLLEDEYSRIWGVFEERVAHFLQERGASLVRELDAMMGISGSERPEVVENGSTLSVVESLAEAVGATSSHPQRARELSTAVKDIFVDRTGPATEWLVRIAANFLTACALGLEQQSSAAVKLMIAKTKVVLDTDVVLSLLCEGEPEHIGLVNFVQRWRRLGGAVLVADPVLEEVARHAYIASKDFAEVRHLLPGSDSDRSLLINNAFVRAFAILMSRGEAALREWPAYISQYKGGSEYDHANVLGNLVAEYSINRLPARSLGSEPLERDVRSFLVSLSNSSAAKRGRTDPWANDKARRDAFLYVSIAEFVQNLRSTDPGASCLLVSSARKLQATETEFKSVNEPNLVSTIAAMIYLMSLLPDVSLGLSALKSFLFDERRSRFSNDFERRVLRLVRGSSERSMPFAKRGLLINSIRARVLKDARESGDRSSDANIFDKFEREAFLSTGEGRTLELITDALDAVGVDRRLEEQNRLLRQQVQQLESKIEQLRTGKALPRPKGG